MSPVVSIQFFKVSQGKSDKYHLIIPRHPARSLPHARFFYFCPSDQKDKEFLSLSQKWRHGGTWVRRAFLTRVKVGPRSEHKSVTESAGGCRHLSSEGNALSITPPPQLPLQNGAGPSLSGLPQGFGDKMHLKALLTGTVLVIHSSNQHLYVPSRVSSSYVKAVKLRTGNGHTWV